MNETNENSALLSRSIFEETDSLFRLHKAQVYPGGILPKKGGEQHRNIRIGPSSAVHGSVIGNNVTIESAEKLKLSDGKLAPGTEIQGSINCFGDAIIGNGIWIQGGIIAEGDVIIDSSEFNSDSPGHVLIEGGVAGRNVTIGDGVVILGPVIGLESCRIGENVTVRDAVSAPNVKINNGCMIGGLQAEFELEIGDLVTIGASQILIPSNQNQVSINHPIRSPFPGCNNCPQNAIFDGETEIARKLACHLYANRDGNSITKGSCEEWTNFNINATEEHFEIGNFSLVSNIPKDSVNTKIYEDDATVWERGGENNADLL
jgi:hypothetical protein